MTNRLRGLVLLVAALGIVALGWLTLPPGVRSASSGTQSQSQERPPPMRVAPTATPPGPPSDAPPLENPVGTGLRLAWPGVDLEEVRQALPRNAYWELGAPTEDPEVQRRRAEEKVDRNRRFGLVQAGTASVAQVDAYYDERERISEDYVVLTSHLLETYPDLIPERDVAMLELARDMNAKRLLQLPQERARAHDRRLQQDEARERYQAGGI